MRIILLVAHDSRRRWLCSLLQQIDPRCRVESASSTADASSSLVRGHADMLVLDLALAQGQPLALTHHLARFAPATMIVGFEESAAPPIFSHDAWPWDDAPVVLRRAIASLRRGQPPSCAATP